MTVDSTSLLVALKQKPHPSDAGSESVSEKDVTIRRPERIQFVECEKMTVCYRTSLERHRHGKLTEDVPLYVVGRIVEKTGVRSLT